MPKHTGRDCVEAVRAARLIISHEHFVGVCCCFVTNALCGCFELLHTGVIPSTTFVSCAIADCCCAKFVMEENVETKRGKVKYAHNGFCAFK